MELTDQEKRDARIIIEGFFGAHVADQITINKVVLEVLGEMLASNERCSRLMDLVPRPSGFRPGLSYIRRQLRDLARRVASNDSSYLACQNIVAASYRTKLARASALGF